MIVRLEKAINGLKKIADRYEKREQFEFSPNQIIFKPKVEKIAWIWFYIAFLIITPIGIFIYLLSRQNSDQLTMLLLIGLSGYFAITLYSLLRGQQTLTIDFPRKQFIFSRIHRPLLKKNELNPIDFSKVHSVALKQMALAYNN